MKKLAWVTDPHFNFLDVPVVQLWADQVAGWEPDALLVGGDIAEADDIEDWLRLLDERMGCPVYFVLGNHDFYGGSIADVRERVRKLAKDAHRLHWLPDSGVVELSPRTALVGHGCWGDARLGDFANSEVMLNDYLRIEELVSCRAKTLLRDTLMDLGAEAAAYLRETVGAALKQFQQVFVLTHVPPFHQACWHENRLSDDNWLPHFSCGAAGEVLLELAAAHPERTLTVLCGHVHSAGECWPLPNLCVKTGAAEYGAPATQAPIVIR